MYCFCLLQTFGGAKKMVVPKGLYIYGGVGKRLIQNRQNTRHGLPENAYIYIYVTLHYSTAHVLIHWNYSPLAETAASHSLPSIPPFYPSLVIPTSPSLAVVCCVYLPSV